MGAPSLTEETIHAKCYESQSIQEIDRKLVNFEVAGHPAGHRKLLQTDPHCVAQERKEFNRGILATKLRSFR